VIEGDPGARSLWWALRYVLAVPTNRALIAASALGYFYLTGLRTFAVVFFGDRFGLSTGVASTLLVAIGSGSILGVLLTGRFADRAIARGHPAARPVVAGACFLATAAVVAPALLLPGLLLAAPLLFLGTVGLGGVNPPLDAARLDVIHSRLRGRAEAVRSLCRSTLEALAPLAFGVVSALLGSLDATLLVMLAAPVGSGLLLCVVARRTYSRDAAAALASERRTARV
jgi:predicted MFS family arabinose efflux permease